MRGYGFLLFVFWMMGVEGMITLESIRYLGGVTQADYGVLRGLVEGGGGGGVFGGGGQVVFAEGHERRGIEDEMTTVLENLTTTLLLELNKPLSPSQVFLTQMSTNETTSCPTILAEYRSFLSSTVHFLHAIQELQMLHNFNEEGGVANGVRVLQRQWASRSGNSQKRSFIEQQIACYNPTRCFPKNEVLIRGVEVVEYLNDLLDSFN